MYSEEPILLNEDEADEINEDPVSTEIFDEMIYPSPQSGLVNLPSDQFSKPCHFTDLE